MCLESKMQRSTWLLLVLLLLSWWGLFMPQMDTYVNYGMSRIRPHPEWRP